MLDEYKKGSLTPAQKCCFSTPRPAEELYNVVNDPDEMNNLASNPAYQEVLLAMRGRLQEIREAGGDYLPEERTPDDFFRKTGLPTKYRIRPRPSKAEYMEARQKGIVLMNPDFE